MADIRDSQLYCATRLFGAYGYSRGMISFLFAQFSACARMSRIWNKLRQSVRNVRTDIMRSAGIVLQPHDMQYIKEVFLLKNKTYSRFRSGCKMCRIKIKFSTVQRMTCHQDAF